MGDLIVAGMCKQVQAQKKKTTPVIEIIDVLDRRRVLPRGHRFAPRQHEFAPVYSHQSLRFPLELLPSPTKILLLAKIIAG